MGHGDTLALCRYAPLLAAGGYDVRLEVRESMIELFRRSMPGVTVVPRAVNYPHALGIPDFDYHLPLLSAPHALGTGVATVPWHGPYLRACPSLVEEWRERLKLCGETRLKIGLCWSSGIRKGIWLGVYGRRKSATFRSFAPLFSYDAVFCSLQCGPPAAENTMLPGLGAEEPSWDETAALVECLDVVITVDSAIAHLAGAMGKPVWLLMHTEGSWHWLADTPGAPWQNRSPWYPTARVFRQKRAYEWEPVVEQIAVELQGLS
jgi:hypothetical protein